MVSRVSSDAPSSAPSSPKGVNFGGVTGISRPATHAEHWAFYWFEMHAADCRSCVDPYSRYKSGKHLCKDGNKLAQDIGSLVYRRDGEVYSRVRDGGQKVRVEIPAGYERSKLLLKAVERGSKHKIPFVSSKRAPEPVKSESRQSLSPRGHHLQPSARVPLATFAPKYTSLPLRQKQSAPVDWGYAPSSPQAEPVQPLSSYQNEEERFSKRGSLWESDIARLLDRQQREEQLAYKLEVREPPKYSSRSSGRHHSHRHSTILW